MSTALVPQDQAAQGQLEAAQPAQGMVEAITRSEIDTQISTAKRYPRSIARFRQNALSMATLDAETAASCSYALKRKDAEGRTKIIEGPSVRLSEMVAVSWTNLRSGGRIIGEEGGFIVAQGFAHDLEANLRVEVEVRRRITGRSGHRYSDDMVATTAMAAIAIAQRNALFKVIPRVFVDVIAREAKVVATGKDAKTVDQRRRAAIDHFTQKLKVPKDRLFAYLTTDTNTVAGIEDIGVPELDLLHGLLTAIKEGETTLEEAGLIGEAKAAATTSPLAGASAPPPAVAATSSSSGPVTTGPVTVDAEHEVVGTTGAVPANDAGAQLLIADIRTTKNSAELKKLGAVISTQPQALQAQVQPVYDQVMLEHKGREAAAQKGQG